MSDGAGRWRPCRFGPALEPTGAVGDRRPSPRSAITVAFALVKGERPEWRPEAHRARRRPHRAVRGRPVGRAVGRDQGGPRGRAPRGWWPGRRPCRAAAAGCPRSNRSRPFADVARLDGAARADRGGGRRRLATPSVLVGPEGGWSDDGARRRPCPPSASGRHVLRAETAAIAAAVLLAALRAGLPFALSGGVRFRFRLVLGRARGGWRCRRGEMRHEARGSAGWTSEGRGGERAGARGLRATRSASACGPSAGRRACRCRRSRPASSQEFKASVLGAYERGERAISVPRLQRLARFYNVPVDQLLPARRGRRLRGADERGRRPPRRPLGRADSVTIDLTRLGVARRPERRAARPLPADDPGAAAGLQRPHAHHPPRRPAGHRLHPRHLRRRAPSPASTTSGLCLSLTVASTPCSASTSTSRSARGAATTARSRPGPTATTSPTRTCTPAAPRSSGGRGGCPPATSVFVGGGTPSLVPGAALVAVLGRHPAGAGRRGHRRVQPRHGDRRAAATPTAPAA